MVVGHQHITQEVNATTIASVAQTSIDHTFLTQYKTKILLSVGDAARYMLKADKLLEDLYPQYHIITCIAHVLHRIAECIRDHFSNVDDLISSTNAAAFKLLCPIIRYSRKIVIFALKSIYVFCI